MVCHKGNEGFKISLKLKNESVLSSGDFIFLSCRTQKAALKKLLSRLGFRLIDYRRLKRKSHGLFITFFYLMI